MPVNQISDFDRAIIIAVHQQGWSNQWISTTLDMLRSSVIRIMRLFHEVEMCIEDYVVDVQEQQMQGRIVT